MFNSIDSSSAYSRVAVYTPKALMPDHLHKPCILVGRVPLGTKLLQATPLPNLLECLGMATGGGPVGIIALQPEMTPVTKPGNIFIAGYPPNATAPTSGDGAILGRHLGVCVTAGVVLNYFVLVYEGVSAESLRWAPFKEVEESLKPQGYAAVELVRYKTPEYLTHAHTNVGQREEGGVL